MQWTTAHSLLESVEEGWRRWIEYTEDKRADALLKTLSSHYSLDCYNFVQPLRLDNRQLFGQMRASLPSWSLALNKSEIVSTEVCVSSTDLKIFSEPQCVSCP